MSVICGIGESQHLYGQRLIARDDGRKLLRQSFVIVSHGHDLLCDDRERREIADGEYLSFVVRGDGHQITPFEVSDEWFEYFRCLWGRQCIGNPTTCRIAARRSRKWGNCCLPEAAR